MTGIFIKNKKHHIYFLEKSVDILELVNSYFEDYFEVDPLIASSVMLLNEKGYITEMSCSGHFHERLLLSDPCFEEEILDGCLQRKENSDGMFECLYQEKCTIQNSFVRFYSEYDFESLPFDWHSKDNNRFLYHEYKTNLTEFEFYEQQIKGLKNLYEWVNSLPPIIKE